MKFIAAILIFSVTVLSGCNFKPESESLPLSVKSTLSLLQDDPQFVMYMNFKNMRRSSFWQRNISDSLLNAEKTFGSLLNTFKIATGASLSEGIDELYYSNSWFGENAIVMKGILDKNKLSEFISGDSLFSVAKNINGIPVYFKSDNGLYFYFKDNNTICASNYLKQIDAMMKVTDSSKSGILQNEKVLNAINNTVYKEDIWMISTEKVFIRGIFQNFLQSSSGIESDHTDSSDSQNGLNITDSAALLEKLTIENLYKRFNSISFSSKMSDELDLVIQCECINDESSKYLRSILNGVITVAKLKSSGNKKNSSMKILDGLKLNRYDNSVYIEMKVNDSNINELRNANLMSEPE